MADQPGICKLCQSTASKRGMARHLESCVAKESADRSKEIIQLRIDCPERPAYCRWGQSFGLLSTKPSAIRLYCS